MREVLFRIGQEAPERLSSKMQTELIAYAWMTWIYRAVLFAGIAALVYTKFAKILGIGLAVFEIVYFIA